MASQAMLTQRIIKGMLAKHAARQPSRVRYDSRGGRDSADTTGLIIGSRTPVDCSYAIKSTTVTYTPPVTPPPVIEE